MLARERGPRWQIHAQRRNHENLRPPWPPGTSGNPAGYSRGRRISDAIERLIEEMALDREFGATAIAMALGKKYMLKRKVKDPETGEEIWVEHKPDIARHLCAIFGVRHLWGRVRHLWAG